MLIAPDFPHCSLTDLARNIDLELDLRQGMKTLIIWSNLKRRTHHVLVCWQLGIKKTHQKMLEVALRGLVLRGMEVVLRGTQVISPARGLALHLHDHHFQHSALLFFGAFWTGSFLLFYALFNHHSFIEDVSTITAPSYIWTSALFKIRQIFQCTRKCFGQQGFHPIAFTLVELVEVQRSQFLLSACEGCHRCFTPLARLPPLARRSHNKSSML